MKSRREKVFEQINGERDYQDRRWNEDSTQSGGLHSPAEWLVYMQHYLNLAVIAASTKGDPESALEVMTNIRKITAMGVAAMEQNRTLPR